VQLLRLKALFHPSQGQERRSVRVLLLRRPFAEEDRVQGEGDPSLGDRRAGCRDLPRA